VIDPASVPAEPDAARHHRLMRLGGSRGVVVGIALDHRDSLQAVLEREGLATLRRDHVRELKLRLTRVLAPAATAIMLDEELGSRVFDAGAIPSSVALIMPLEAQGYEAAGDERVTTLLPDFTPDDAIKRGADACKLFVPYRADDERTSVRQDEVVRSTAEACHRLGLPLVVEPVPYRRSTETPSAFAEAWERLVVGSVVRLRTTGLDLLKLPFPVPDLDALTEDEALAACRTLNEACGGIPWVLLGGGVSLDTFGRQLRVAGTAGGAGFLAGRGIWGPAVTADPDEAERRATGVSLPAFIRCAEIAERACRPLSPAAR
jgi:tagatose-1,6-bisphosphate aldolase